MRDTSQTHAASTEASELSVAEPTRIRRVLRPGDLLGQHIIARELGRGGMGIVYAALDPRLGREVALKVIRDPNDESKRERALLEAQSLASIKHPNVVTIHEVGRTDEGEVFISMELLGGQTLHDWIKAQPPPVPELRRVFADAARGLLAVHERGLVHGDFKPDNVMLDELGTPRVLDFGLARFAEGESLPGSYGGTRSYMAPEVRMRSAPNSMRSDQYSFAIALWEALYGERPWADADGVKAPRRGRSGRVPRVVRQALQRALADQPAQRFDSLEPLIAALEHRPHRGWSVAAVGGLVALSGVLGASLRAEPEQRACVGAPDKLAGVWDEDRRAALQAAMLGTELSYAQQTWELSAAALDAYARDWSAGWVEACEATQLGEQSGQLLDLRMACLDERSEYLRLTVDELTQADTKSVQRATKAARALPSLARCADAEALLSELPPPADPETAARVAELEHLQVEAIAKKYAGRYEQALALLESVLDQGAELDYEPLMVRARVQQQNLQNKRGDYAEAEATAKQALEGALALGMKSEAAELASSLILLNAVHLNRLEAARAWVEVASGLSRAEGSPNQRTRLLIRRAALAVSEGEYHDARADLERAVDLITETPELDEHMLVVPLGELGRLASYADDHERAREHIARALAIETAVVGPGHPRVVTFHANLGTTLNLLGRNEEAREQFELALGVLERTLGLEHPTAGPILAGLAALAQEDGDLDRAQTHYQHAHDILVARLGPEHPNVAAVVNNLAHLALERQDYARARELYQRAFDIREHALGPEHPVLVPSLVGLVHSLVELDQAAVALPLAQRAHELEAAGDNPIMLPETSFALACALWAAPEQGGRDRARALELARSAQRSFAGDDNQLPRVEAWLGERELGG